MGRVGVPPADLGILPKSLEHDDVLASAKESGETPDSAGGTPTLPAEHAFAGRRFIL